MHHLAVDLGSRQSHFCIRTPEGQVEKEARIPNSQLPKLFALVPQSRVVLETSSECFVVADMARQAGHLVNVVPAALAPSLGVGQRGVKTDKRDAENLSLASCRMETLPSVHVPSPEAREWRALLTSRDALVTTRTRLINSVKGWMRTQLLRVKAGSTSTFPKRARELATELSLRLPAHIEWLLVTLETLNEQIALANAAVKAATSKDAACVRLMTVPGVGPTTALSFRAAVDDVSRFKRPPALQSYLGLTPGERSSGEKRNKVGITKAGSVNTRRMLVQAAWVAYVQKPDEPMVQWARRLSEHKPKQVAVTALARKMVGILFALWRDGTNYDAAHKKT